jgi:hypothetical protein
MKDYPISQLRMVTLRFKSGHIRTHMCHESQVDTLVKASIKLHVDRLSNVWEIRVDRLNLETRTYWWCSEELKISPNGAQLNEYDHIASSRVD